MIPHARITSDSEAVVHLGDRDVPLSAPKIQVLRSQVKDVFIDAAKDAGEPIDVVITEPDRVHYLRVEPNGRIKSRPQDDQEPFGPVEESTAAANGAATDADTPAPLAPGIGAGTPAPAPGASSSTEDGPSSAHREELSAQPTATSAASAPSAPSASSAPSAPSAPIPSRSPSVVSPVGASARSLPTLDDLRSTSTSTRRRAAQQGWRRTLAKLTGGAITLGPGKKERQELDQIDRIRRPLDSPKNIVVVNLKGGAHKTTACLMIASTLGSVRGGGILAWDNNETRGTLGWRGEQGQRQQTAVDLLRDLDALNSRGGATAAELDQYVRHQADVRFDILASDEDAGSAASIDARAFDQLDSALSRLYRVKVIDTGNNVRASNWLAAVESADQLVIISTVREDTFNAAAWMIDELRATGYADKVDSAVTVLSHSSPQGIDPVLHKRLVSHFGAHTRAVLEVPFEKQFVDGAELDWACVSPQTKGAWREATAAIVDGL